MSTILYISSTNPPDFLLAPKTYQTVHIQSTIDMSNIDSSLRFEFIFFDIRDILVDHTPDTKLYTELFLDIKKQNPSASIIILVNKENVKDAVPALKAGASSYLIFPIIKEEVTLSINELKEVERTESELEFLRDKFWFQGSPDIITTASPIMNEVLKKVKAVAPTKTTIIITGESGTGKGVLAKLIHMHSERANNQFLSLHCGAIPENLIESELFGHEKGAFTGADKRKLGCFEMANEGTLFLDEIGTISKSAQIKLLQVLQDHFFRRIGGQEQTQCNVRIIAATNENLKDLVNKKEFREDLYYRLNVFNIELPPLRDRKEDLPYLINKIIQKLNNYGNKEINGIQEDALIALRRYEWPGNIRELENLIERAYIIESTQTLTTDSFPVEIITNNNEHTNIPVNTKQSLADFRKEATENAEKQYLVHTLKLFNGKIKDTAQYGGISTRQLHKLLTKHKINKSLYKESSSPSFHTDLQI